MRSIEDIRARFQLLQKRCEKATDIEVYTARELIVAQALELAWVLNGGK